MRIQGVTGDLPPVAQLMVETPPKVEAPPTAPPPAVAAPAAAGETGGDHTSSDHQRRPPQPLAAFDPPLIAQRAVLGLPVGMMVVEHARAEGISYLAAWEAVDRAMPLKTPDPAA